MDWAKQCCYKFFYLCRAQTKDGYECCIIGRSEMRHVCAIIREVGRPLKLCEGSHVGMDCPNKSG